MPSPPPTASISNLTGTWTLSKPLSDDTDPIFTLQGIGYLLRKAAKIGSVSLGIVQDSSATPPTLTMTIIPPGGFKGATNVRKLDGSSEQEKNFMFGEVSITWRPKGKAELEGYLADEEWVGDGILEELIKSTTGGWINHGAWGLVTIDGTTYLIKRSLVSKGDETAKARMVYEYTSPAN